MTKREAAIIAAYTGVFIGTFDELHKYIEEILERPVFTHELASQMVAGKIKEKSKKDFINIKVEG